MNWRHHIIRLTESEKARAGKIDASFFPPVVESRLAEWEQKNEIYLPEEIRSYLLQSEGLEAQRGEAWPVLPLDQWDVLRDECASATPWVHFGETASHRYLLSTGHSPSIYRCETFGSNEEFFAATFSRYLELVFRGEA